MLNLFFVTFKMIVCIYLSFLSNLFKQIFDHSKSKKTINIIYLRQSYHLYGKWPQKHTMVDLKTYQEVMLLHKPYCLFSILFFVLLY
jgi:hypothetical protein